MSSIDAIKVITPKSSISAPLLPRTKQPSRKGTKAWRRHVDITKEEGAQHDLLERQRLGVADLNERPDDDLFQLDTKPDPKILLKTPTRLRVKDILQPRSGYPSFSRRAHIQPPSRQFSVSELKRINRAADHLTRQPNSTRKKPTTDRSQTKFDHIWDACANEPPSSTTSFAYEPKPVRAPKTLSAVPRAKLTQKAVKVAHAGASYNPRYQDHQALLMDAVQQEEQETLKNKQVKGKVPNFRRDLFAGAMTVDDDEPSVLSDLGDTDEAFVVLPTRRLTRAERNRQARRKVRELIARRNMVAKLDRLRGPEIDQTLSELDKVQALRDATIQQRRLKRLERASGPLRLSRCRFQHTPKATEVQLTEDLAGSLRLIKPEVNLARDRFKSLQERNIIETRVRTFPRRRYPLKEYVKRDYKEFE